MGSVFANCSRQISLGKIRLKVETGQRASAKVAIGFAKNNLLKGAETASTPRHCGTTNRDWEIGTANLSGVAAYSAV
jgi:hypothetical protein